MPDNIIELYVPCRLIEVTVSVAPTQHLSHLEALVLRAMYAGISKFRDLVEMFGLGQRPTLDLISDLWHRGYVALDMEKSELWLADHVREALTNNKLDALSTGEVQERKTRVAQELLLVAAGDRDLAAQRTAVADRVHDQPFLAELGRRLGEGTQARRGLEGTDGTERRQLRHALSIK